MIEFITAHTSDIPAIQQLSHEIWHAHYPGIISRAQIEYMLSKMYATETIQQEIENGVVYEFIKTDGDTTGYLSFVFEENATVKLSKLYVLQEYHGKGIGNTALEHLKERALQQGAKKIYLFVNKQNTKAITAYTRFGFTISESVVNEFGDGYVMDDYRMNYTLE